MYKFTQIVLAILVINLTLFASVAKADYQNEVSLSLDKTEYDDGDKSDGSSLDFFHYFDKVDTSTGPWELADYIQRTGYIGFSAIRIDSTRQSSSSDFNGNFLAAGMANPDSPFVFGLSYYMTDSDSQGTTSYSGESDGYGFTIGYFIQQYTLVTFGHSESETKYTGIDLAYKSKGNDVSISTVLLQDNGTAIALSATHAIRDDSDGDEFKTTTLSGDYYFNPRLGVGGFISTITSNVNLNDRQTLGINVSYFLNRQVKLAAQYSESEPDNESGTTAGLASDSITVSGSVYF